MPKETACRLARARALVGGQYGCRDLRQAIVPSHRGRRLEKGGQLFSIREADASRERIDEMLRLVHRAGPNRQRDVAPAHRSVKDAKRPIGAVVFRALRENFEVSAEIVHASPSGERRYRGRLFRHVSPTSRVVIPGESPSQKQCTPSNVSKPATTGTSTTLPVGDGHPPTNDEQSTLAGPKLMSTVPGPIPAKC